VKTPTPQKEKKNSAKKNKKGDRKKKNPGTGCFPTRGDGQIRKGDEEKTVTLLKWREAADRKGNGLILDRGGRHGEKGRSLGSGLS